jgi:hypothetical protein
MPNAARRCYGRLACTAWANVAVTPRRPNPGLLRGQLITLKTGPRLKGDRPRYGPKGVLHCGQA